MARKTTLDKVLEAQTRLKKMTFEEFEGESRLTVQWQADWIDFISGLVHMAFVEAKGVNYVSFIAGFNLADGSREYEITIRRVPWGLTPAEKNCELTLELMKAKERIAELEARLSA